MSPAAEARVGQQIRATHPYAFRSGQWGSIVMMAPLSERECWLITWPEGDTDFWPTTDPDAGYEFRPTTEA